MPSPSFFTQAGNFISTAQGGVDPRTGLFNVSLPLVNLHTNNLAGTTLALSLQYSPLSSVNEGFGRGFALNLTRYDTATGKLVLSTGEVYRVSSSGKTIKQKKLKNFIFEKTDDSNCRVIYKSGLTEHLSLHGTVYVPTRISAPDGRSMMLTWGTSYTPVRLTQVADDDGTVLCTVTYPDATVATTKFTLLPDNAESSYRLIFKFARSFLIYVTRQTITPAPRWSYFYDDVGPLKNYRAITGLSFPTGLKEEVAYYSGRGMAFPDIANLPPLPCVYQHILTPGGGQPRNITQWTWTQKNYLGKDAGLSQWQPDTDQMLNILLSDYQYGSTAKMMDTDSSTVLSSVTRSYNSYHLLVSEANLRNGKTYKQTTEYHAKPGVNFDEQPAQYALPMSHTDTWNDGSGATPHTRVTLTQFDEAGNPLRQTAPDGTVTEYAYYPAKGESKGCPADPHGFTRYLKRKKVTPQSIKGDEVATASKHYWKKLDKLSGESYVVVADRVKETIGSVKMLTTREYFDNPNDVLTYGREKKRTITLTPDVNIKKVESFTRMESFSYASRQDGLYQSTTMTTHDGLSASRSTLRHPVLGLLLTETDAQGVPVKFTYDKTGRVLTQVMMPGMVHERKTTWSYTIEDDGPVTTETDAAGNQMKTFFDGAGREIKRQRLDKDVTQNWFDVWVCTYNVLGEAASGSGSDWLTSISEQYKIGMTATHDGWGAVSAQEFTDGKTVLQELNPVALTFTVSLKGGTTKSPLISGKLTTEFDKKSLLPLRKTRTDTHDTVQGTQLCEWDGLGRLRRVTDELGHETAWTRDVIGRVLTQTLPDGTGISRVYASHLTGNQVVSISVIEKGTDGKKKTRLLGTQKFDGFGRVTERVCGGRTTKYTYDGASPVPSTVTLPSDKTQTYTYIPELGNALSSLTADGITQAFSYDAHTGELLRAMEGSTDIQNTLYPSGRLKTEAFTLGGGTRNTSYFRTLSGATNKYSDIDNKTMTYGRDAYGRVTTITDEALAADIKYDALGRLSKQTVTDSVTKATLTTTLEYDDFGHEIKRTVEDSGGVTLTVSQTWLHNGLLAERKTEQNKKMIRREQYGYDTRNRLVRYTASGTSLPRDAYGHEMTAQAYLYDVLSNLTTVTTPLADGSIDVATYHYDNGADPMQLTSVTHTHAEYPQSITLAYDACGRMTKDEMGRTLEYDVTGRLTGMKRENASGVSYGYDALNRLVSQQVSDADTRQLYYRDNERVNEVLQQQNKVTRLIKSGHICLGVASNSGLTLTAGDHHESLQWSHDRGQKDGQLHVWAPYGNIDSIDSIDSTDGLLGFNGERIDPVSGVYHLGNGYRAYNPVLMRFNCPDNLSPFGAGGINPYAYCAGDPVNYTDPSGHISWQGILGIIMGVLGLSASVFTAGASIAAAGGVMAALSAASTTSLLVGGLGVVSDATAIASGVEEDHNPHASSILGWVSMATGLAGMAAGIGLIRSVSRGTDSGSTVLRLRGGGDRAAIPLNDVGLLERNVRHTGILDLPDEMIREIGRYLPLEDLQSFRGAYPEVENAITVGDLTRAFQARERRIKAIMSFQTPLEKGEMTMIRDPGVSPEEALLMQRRIRAEKFIAQYGSETPNREFGLTMRRILEMYKDMYGMDDIHATAHMNLERWWAADLNNRLP